MPPRPRPAPPPPPPGDGPPPLRVGLLGTGSATGWPNPWCPCASCGAAREAGSDRGPTCALVDGGLLLDPGEAALRTAARAGHDLSGVAVVLLSGPLLDRGAATLLARRGAGRTDPLTVAAPPAALAGLGDAVAPGDPVTLQPLEPGDRLAAGGFEVTVVGVGTAPVPRRVGYAVTGPSGSTVLSLPPVGVLPVPALDALEGAAVDIALLPCGAPDQAGPGAVSGPGAGLDGLARLLAALRRRGAVTASTRVVAVHLDHTNPPPAELRRRLALLGAESAPDGALLVTQEPAPVPREARRVLVLGGARSGKSAEAERRLAAEPSVTYVATGPTPSSDDPDWAARVAAHRDRRPGSWRTVETTALPAVLADPPDGAPLLVDDLGLWLTAAMTEAGSWEGAAGAPTELAAATDALVAAWRGTSAHVVAVSSEVGLGVHPETPAGRLFRDEMGRLNARLAEESDEVWYVVAGVARRLR